MSESLFSAHAQIDWWRCSTWAGWDFHTFSLGVSVHGDREDGYLRLSVSFLVGPFFFGSAVDAY